MMRPAILDDDEPLVKIIDLFPDYDYIGAVTSVRCTPETDKIEVFYYVNDLNGSSIELPAQDASDHLWIDMARNTRDHVTLVEYTAKLYNPTFAELFRLTSYHPFPQDRDRKILGVIYTPDNATGIILVNSETLSFNITASGGLPMDATIRREPVEVMHPWLRLAIKTPYRKVDLGEYREMLAKQIRVPEAAEVPKRVLVRELLNATRNDGEWYTQWDPDLAFDWEIVFDPNKCVLNVKWNSQHSWIGIESENGVFRYQHYPDTHPWIVLAMENPDRWITFERFRATLLTEDGEDAYIHRNVIEPMMTPQEMLAVYEEELATFGVAIHEEGITPPMVEGFITRAVDIIEMLKQSIARQDKYDRQHSEDQAELIEAMMDKLKDKSGLRNQMLNEARCVAAFMGWLRNWVYPSEVQDKLLDDAEARFGLVEM